MVRTSVLRTTATLWGLLCLAGFTGAAAGADMPGRSSLPAVPAPFEGKLNTVEEGSTPWYPVPLAAPKGAPNVLLVMTDDVGFGAKTSIALSCAESKG